MLEDYIETSLQRLRSGVASLLLGFDDARRRDNFHFCAKLVNRMLLRAPLSVVSAVRAGSADATKPSPAESVETLVIDPVRHIAKTLVLDEQDRHGDTALHYAVKIAIEPTPINAIHIEEIDAPLLETCLRHQSTRLVHGFSVSELQCAQRLHNVDGLMPIHIAAAHGNVPVCEALLKARAPINARSLRRTWGKRSETGEIHEIAAADKTALHFAVALNRDRHEMNEGSEACDTALVRLLLELGADVNAMDFDGKTPFHIAVEGGMLEVASLLADAGADLHSPYGRVGCRSFGKKSTALHLATLRQDIRMVELLTERGAPIDAIGRDGWTPLCLAARQGSVDVAKALIAAGANVFAPSGNGMAPLDIAAINAKHGGSALLELLQQEVAAVVLDIAYSWKASWH